MIFFRPITALSLGSLNISVHGLFMAIGVLIGWIAAKRPVVERKLDPQILENIVTTGGLLITSGLFSPQLFIIHNWCLYMLSSFY